MKTKKDRDTSHLHRAWFASVWPASRTGKVLLAIFVIVGMFFAFVFYTTPHIDERGALAGLIIEFAAFPGWDSLGAIASHFRFVRDHHKHIKKVGVVTDSPLGTVAENLASHFVAAEIRRFPAGELETARRWVMDRP